MKLLTMLVATAVVVACAATPPPRTPEEALYRRRCGNCHDLFSPAAYSAPDWAHNVARMRANAGLTDEEAAALTSWLQTAR